MIKELTPEEKKQFGLGDTNTPEVDGLTPEQIAKNLENQNRIAEMNTQKDAATAQEEETNLEPDQENEIDLSKDAALDNNDLSLDTEDTSLEKDDAETDDVLDLDNILDKADHTYEIEKDDIAAAPSSLQDTSDNLESKVEETEPVNPERDALQAQVLVNKETKKNNQENLDQKHIRTFHKDVSLLKNTGSTAVTSQMLREAHQEEREKKAETSAGKQIKTLSIISAIIIVVALGVVMYAVKSNRPSTTALTTTNNIPSLLPVDIQIPIDVTNAYHFKIKSTLAEKIAEQTTFKNMAHFYFGEASRNGGRLLSTSEFFAALNIQAPSTLLSVTTDQFMFGTYTIQEPYPFLLLPITSFPKAQDAMIAWEGNMLRDLKDVFAIPEESVPPEAFDAKFRPDVINNQHVRLLYTPIIKALEETFIMVDKSTTEEEVLETLTLSDMEIFAQCISDSGATFFGADWCPHCADQKELFGETAATLLPYQECSGENNVQIDLCNAEGIESYPTWEFADESRLTGSLPLETLAEETSCLLPEEIIEEESDKNTEEQTDNIPETETMLMEEPEIITPEQPQTLTQTKRSVTGESLALTYTFINEYTLLITTDPLIIPEIVKRYTNRQIFLR